VKENAVYLEWVSSH